MLTILVAALFNHFAESRVYCEDKLATRFVFIGYSCPVNCQNVLEALKRLKLLDELEEKPESQDNISLSLRKSMDPHTRRFYLVCEKIFENKLATDEVLKELDQYQNTTACRSVVDDNYVEDKEECHRRSNQKQFLKAFTDILNKHAHGLYKFTEDITAMILKKILGSDMFHSTDDKSVMKKLLAFLRKALARHKRLAHASFITLRSRHCLLSSVPGCFCQTGYVEQDGACLSPDDCLTTDESKREFAEYMYRVQVA